METTEALKLLVKMRSAYQKMGLNEYTEALKIATNAIDDELFSKNLRTPHEPLSCIANIGEKEEVLAYCCPNCALKLERDYQYCPYCGQVLDWSDNCQEKENE